MNTSYADFCNAYQEKIKEKDNKEDYLAKRTTFSVYQHTCGMISYSHRLFALDEEDLRYLYNKYSKRLIEELEQNIQEIKSKYPL